LVVKSIMATLLGLHDVSKSFGSVKAADRLTLAVEEGEALGVVGPNGAGKSVMFGLVTGAIAPDEGRVVFAGEDITRLSPFRRCRAGIGRSWQIPHPFAKMTVFENVVVGAAFGTGRPERACWEDAAAILAATGLLEKANRLAGSLTLLDRKRLEMARALATRPRLLLLDEIAGGLTEAECQALVEQIRAIHAAGTTIVWIEHIVHALTAVVGRLVVMNFGAVLAEGEPRAVMASPAVHEVYLGIEAA
jgi:branched-chain amino acid transport system ATP-binding protein